MSEHPVERSGSVLLVAHLLPLFIFPFVPPARDFALYNLAEQAERGIHTSRPRADQTVSPLFCMCGRKPRVRLCVMNLCVSWIFVWCYRRRCVKLTNGTQSDVAKDDDDENKTANHISAAPGEKKSVRTNEMCGKTKRKLKLFMIVGRIHNVSPMGVGNLSSLYRLFNHFIVGQHSCCMAKELYICVQSLLPGMTRCHLYSIQCFQRNCSGVILTF